MALASSVPEYSDTKSTDWRDGALTIMRVFLGIVFVTYGLVKVLGGQYNYGDWVIDKNTVDGTSLVWAFYGYSPFYGRFTGLFELVPAILLLIPRAATIGAGALFAVSLNVVVMDFAYHYPAVKYFALAYTVMLAILMWADRRKWELLLLDPRRADALVLPPDAFAWRAPSPFSLSTRRALRVLTALFALGAAHLVILSVTNGPAAASRRVLESRVQPGERVQLLGFRQTGLIGVNSLATVDFAVVGPQGTRTLAVHARRISVLPWRVTDVGGEPVAH